MQHQPSARAALFPKHPTSWLSTPSFPSDVCTPRPQQPTAPCLSPAPGTPSRPIQPRGPPRSQHPRTLWPLLLWAGVPRGRVPAHSGPSVDGPRGSVSRTEGGTGVPSSRQHEGAGEGGQSADSGRDLCGQLPTPGGSAGVKAGTGRPPPLSCFRGCERVRGRRQAASVPESSTPDTDDAPGARGLATTHASRHGGNQGRATFLTAPGTATSARRAAVCNHRLCRALRTPRPSSGGALP